MPKKIIDFSKTIIYKIVCNDLIITDVYVGHTTNFINRKAKHKSDCNKIQKINKKYKENNKDKIQKINKKYKENNKDKIQEYSKEYYENNKNKIKEYYDKNKDKINTVKKTHYICDICNGTYTYSHKSRHFNSQKHQIALNNND